MGSTLNRLSYENDEINMRKEKQKQFYNGSDAAHRTDTFLRHHGHINDYRHTDSINTYEMWDKNFDQQQRINIKGSARVDSSSISKTNLPDPTIHQTSRYSHDNSNSYYPANTVVMNQSQSVVPGERLSNRGRVRSSSHQQQQKVIASHPANGTQSWHDSNIALHDRSISMTAKPVSLTNRPSIRQNIVTTSHVSSTQISIEKPIYVSIDHEATLVERGKTTCHDRHRKNGESRHSDGCNSSLNTERIRSHSKRYNSTDTSNYPAHIMSSPSFDSVTKTLSDSRDSFAKPMLTNKLSHTVERITSINDNEMKSSNSGSDRRHKRHQLPALSSRTSLPAEPSKRQFENRHSNSLIKRLPPS